MESELAGLYPYGRYEVSDRLSLWGVAGYGAGTLMLTPADGAPIKTEMDLLMGAAGVRGVLVEAPAEGSLELAVKSDVLAVRTRSEQTAGLASAEGDVTRLRLGLEGTGRSIETDGGGTLTPTFELGLRHDGGDAETGLGIEAGAGLAWTDPAGGFKVDLSARGLLAHEAGGFRECGLSDSLAWSPAPGSDRGPSLTLTQTMGTSASEGVDALFGNDTPAGLAANDDAGGLDRRRFEAKLGYGLGAFSDRFTMLSARQSSPVSNRQYKPRCSGRDS